MSAPPIDHDELLLVRASMRHVLDTTAPAYGKRKAVLYATCFVNFHSTAIGQAALGVLARNGIEVATELAGCCGLAGDFGAQRGHERGVTRQHAELAAHAGRGDLVDLRGHRRALRCHDLEVHD